MEEEVLMKRVRISERERQRLRGRKGGLGKEKISQWFKIGP